MSATLRVTAALLVIIVAGMPLEAQAERLPLVAVPQHYELRFAPHLIRETFDGEARIRVRVLRPTTQIVLHAAELTFRTVKVIADGRTVDATASLSPASETVRLALPTEIGPGPADLYFVFSGRLNRQLRGFYIS